MRKTVSFVVLCVVSAFLHAQRDVTEFLGIPVDGLKPEMIQKLKEKGFVSSAINKDILEGEFNGTQVNLHVATNNNKVYRIMLCDATPIDETDIKIRFNRLCRQFKNNSKYISYGDYTIPDDEDISYEMAVNNKRYEALFYQQTMTVDSVAMIEEVRNLMLEKYSVEDLENPTEEITADITETAIDYAVGLLFNKPVWFMISEFYGKYYISMFYDNEYNKANGEDL